MSTELRNYNPCTGHHSTSLVIPEKILSTVCSAHHQSITLSAQTPHQPTPTIMPSYAPRQYTPNPVVLKRLSIAQLQLPCISTEKSPSVTPTKISSNLPAIYLSTPGSTTTVIAGDKWQKQEWKELNAKCKTLVEKCDTLKERYLGKVTACPWFC